VDEGLSNELAESGPFVPLVTSGGCRHPRWRGREMGGQGGQWRSGEGDAAPATLVADSSEEPLSSENCI
jgi:hypothetical protein